MPQVQLLFYREEAGNVPMVEWMQPIPKMAMDKCRKRLELLKNLGHEIQWPYADFLRDGIYELKLSHGSQLYRRLYFYHGRLAVVISHGLIKESKVPEIEIEHALNRMRKFRVNPQKHSFEVK